MCGISFHNSGVWAKVCWVLSLGSHKLHSRYQLGIQSYLRLSELWSSLLLWKTQSLIVARQSPQYLAIFQLGTALSSWRLLSGSYICLSSIGFLTCRLVSSRPAEHSLLIAPLIVLNAFIQENNSLTQGKWLGTLIILKKVILLNNSGMPSYL